MRVLLPLLIGASLAGPPVTAATSVQPGAADTYVRNLAALVNDYRRQNGLEPLDYADDLTALAGEHSANMAEQRQLSHDGFRARFQRASSKICVENVGRNFPTPEALLDGWRLSPAHHRNLLEAKVSRMGIAATARYVTFFACR
jgi:uncharacterized protein YkwD